MNENEENVVVSETTSQVQETEDVSNTQPTEQENTESVESQKLSNQLSQENQSIVSQQETIQQQISEKKAQEEAEKKKAEEEALNSEANKGPSGFAKFMTILLFICLFAFVYFLGDITEYINQKKLEKETAEITNGRLTCTNTKDTDTLTIKIDATFIFENKGIVSLDYVTTTTGDKIKDEEELKKLSDDCKLLKNEVANYSGVTVVCSLNNGVNTVKQNFDYQNIDLEQITAAYSEAGGVYPQFKYKDDINSVQSKMIASDYSCEKVSR